MTSIKAVNIPGDAFVDIDNAEGVLHLHFVHYETAWAYKGPDFEHMQPYSPSEVQPDDIDRAFVRLEDGKPWTRAAK